MYGDLWPGHGYYPGGYYPCPYCAPRCPCCGRPLYTQGLPYITWTTNTFGETAGGCQGCARPASPGNT
jgi:hypothetical protein